MVSRTIQMLELRYDPIKAGNCLCRMSEKSGGMEPVSRGRRQSRSRGYAEVRDQKNCPQVMWPETRKTVSSDVARDQKNCPQKMAKDQKKPVLK